jgi:DNA-binding MarR family transcriptional regulator
MPDDNELGPLADELSRRWRELGRTLTSRRLVASLQPSGAGRLTPTKLHALDVLAEQGGRRIGDLARMLGLDETTATRLVDRLEAADLASRQAEEGDRRATVVVLTPAGEKLVQQTRARRRRFFRDVLDALEPDEQAELVRLTTKAAEALHSRSEQLVRG